MPLYTCATVPDMGKSIGDRIRELREAAHLTQVQLAKKIGVRQSVISDMERDKYGRPSAGLVAQLAHVLGSPPEYILEGTGDRVATTRLTDAERELLRIHRLLEPRDQRRLANQALALLDEPQLAAPPAKKRPA